MNGSQIPLGFDRSIGTTGSVECLGNSFGSDAERRAYYRELLAEKLKDPSFRGMVGFPKGSDEAILRLSDPPYYTACPNPFLEEFVRVYGKPYDPNEAYTREPFAVDVRDGKTDHLYKVHGYPAKLPYLAIVPSILHYTKPGDLVLDGFCGSGMTGVAAQWCGTAPPDYRKKLEAEWKAHDHEPPEWGARRAILNDLGSVASFIAANYNIPFDVNNFATAAQRILDEVETEIGWMYETLHTDGKTRGRINYTVWSEVFSCPECRGEVVFLEQALDKDSKKIKAYFPCPNCSAELTRKQLKRHYITTYDRVLDDTVRVPKRVATMINYSIGKTRYEKTPDEKDLAKLSRIGTMEIPPEVPTSKIPYMYMTHERILMEIHGVTHLHHFFLPRSAHALAALWRRASAARESRNILLFFVEQAIWGMSLMARYTPTHYSQVNQYLKGVYYIASQIIDVSPAYLLDGKLTHMKKAFSQAPTLKESAWLEVGSCSKTTLPCNSLDYIFTDPPFGDNIYYADLNFLVESWHRVWTDAKSEAIVDRAKKKGTEQYQELIGHCFLEYSRVLKPGRWMTVVFSNSKNHIRRAIQEAIGTAGFVVADVRTLDKKQGSYRQTTSSAVWEDLVISAYKPTVALTKRFSSARVTEETVWAFVSEHLKNVPVFITRPSGMDVIAERLPQMLHDRMIGFFVQQRLAIPISGSDFFAGLHERFSICEGMYFLHWQVVEYEKKRATVTELCQLTLIVTDEASAQQWLRQQLQGKPQTYQDLQPQFMEQVQTWATHEKTIELKELLELNFFHYTGQGPVPSQIHSYLSTTSKDMLGKDDPVLRAKAKGRWYVPEPNKQGDLEELRLRTLLREFAFYRASTKRKIKQFRTEAVRAGFKRAYDQNIYATIVEVAKKLPEKVIQEDETLLMYYHVAEMRMGD